MAADTDWSGPDTPAAPNNTPPPIGSDNSGNQTSIADMAATKFYLGIVTHGRICSIGGFVR